MLTWNFGGGPSDSASAFFKMASAYENLFSCSYNHNCMLDMLDNDNIMTAKAFEVVQKVPTDEKDHPECSLCVIDYHKCSLCVKAHPANQKK